MTNEATRGRCKNTIQDGGFRAPRCGRDASPEKDGLCNVCYAAMKRGAAKRAATNKAYDERYAKRTAAQAEIDRKLNAHDAMLEALRAVIEHYEWRSQFEGKHSTWNSEVIPKVAAAIALATDGN